MKLAAFNNNYHEFSSTNPLEADFANISIGDVFYTLQPDKHGLFQYNTYEFAKEIFNFKDDFEYIENTEGLNQFSGVTFNIDISLLDGTNEAQSLTVDFYNGTIQRWDCVFVEEGVVNLSEDKIKVFKGYPFDYSTVTDLGLTRTFVSDGTVLVNNIDTSIMQEVDKDCEGYYLKWHNSQYGYSYYLFEPVSRESFTTKSLGDLREHFSWTDNFLDIGKKGQRKVDVFANIDYKDRELMKSLANSNEVYLYTGRQFDRATQETWLEVKIPTMKVKETNKFGSFPQLVTFNLPQEKTRTRI